MAISWERPTTNIKSDMVCVKLRNYGMDTNLVLLHWLYCYVNIHSYDLIVLQKIESSGFGGGGTLPGLCQNYMRSRNNKINYISTLKILIDKNG